ncbi:MAG: hypothetical protein AWT59_0636 [Candidatus Gallionella acididurans]|uniref:Uncharacterized protein n=1 Tax=Candidatus Gallionella acididurans TaxID=1796491 RepID=A0A139BWB9_9PROT|nr:MAG: hypothetical protein AWT59_0636 [Candidatus Gallionella acididurans]
MTKRIVKKMGKRTDSITPGDIETAKRIANHMAVLQLREELEKVEPRVRTAGKKLETTEGQINFHGPFLHLYEFVAWAERRRPIMPDAPINDETIEYVTNGIKRFLEGKSPWPKPLGNKSKPDLMWEAHWLVNFDETYKHLHEKRHTEAGGLYAAVAGALGGGAKKIESRVRAAGKKLETPEGIIEFQRWVAKRLKATIVRYTPTPKKKAKLIAPDSLTSSTAANTAGSPAAGPAASTWAAILLPKV